MVKNFCWLILCAASFSAFAQTSSSSKKLPQGIYLVVGAFSPDHEDFAVRLTNSLIKGGRHATYGFEETRKYWYVYLTDFTTREACVEEWTKLRKDGAYPDAWVHTLKSAEQPVTKVAETKTPL